MKSHLSLVAVLALGISGCRTGAAPKNAVDSPAPTVNTVVEPEVKPEEKKPEAAKAEKSVLQITVINFLTGGSEQCDVKNKLFTFNQKDQKVKTTLCKNSKVEVYVVSNAGTVEFHAVDRKNKFELPTSSSSFDQNYELGKDRPMLRYYPANPYGFTYVMAEEVTGINPDLLVQWNTLMDESSSLRAQILQTEQAGGTVQDEARERLQEIDDQLTKLAEQMKQSRQR